MGNMCNVLCANCSVLHNLNFERAKISWYHYDVGVFNLNNSRLKLFNFFWKYFKAYVSLNMILPVL